MNLNDVGIIIFAIIIIIVLVPIFIGMGCAMIVQATGLVYTTIVIAISVLIF